MSVDSIVAAERMADVTNARKDKLKFSWAKII